MPDLHNAPARAAPRPLEVTLLASVFVVAACGLVYELAAGALASYLLGDSVLQFSTVIGCYLFAMGVGSWLSRFFDRQLPAHFLRIELMVALAGGTMPGLLFLSNASLQRNRTPIWRRERVRTRSPRRNGRSSPPMPPDSAIDKDPAPDDGRGPG